MQYCVNCLQPDTRPGILFNKNNVCPACIYYESLLDADWESRKIEMDKLVSYGKKNSQSGYDCIVGVSGGKDSTRQAIFVKEFLKMNPLLVNLSYPPVMISKRGVDNVSNMIKHGFDCITINPAPDIWRKLMYESFFNYTNYAKSTELALFSSVPRMAIAYQIPLVWWGDNPALQIGDLNTMGNTGSDGNNLRNLNTLSGGDINWLLEKEIKKNQILQYIYPSNQDMNNAGIKIIFLGYFWKIWSLIDNGNFSALRGLEIRNEPPWEIGDHIGVSALDEDWVTLNQMIKYLKFGFGKVTEYVNEEIRNGRLDREEGIQLCQEFDGKCSEKYIDSFCEYLDISIEKFWIQVDKSVNDELFIKQGFGKYIPKFEVGKDL